jgi:hypothetical protein
MTPEMFSINNQEKFSTNLSFNSTNFTYSISSAPKASLSCVRLRFYRSEQFYQELTSKDGDAFNEASFTSPALSPKIARSNLSE